MTHPIPHRLSFVLTLGLSALIACPALAADAASEPAPTSRSVSNVPQYPAPYAPPTVEQITRVLDSVRDRLEAGAGSRIINTKTHEQVTDLSKPSDNVGLDSGPEHKF